MGSISTATRNQMIFWYSCQPIQRNVVAKPRWTRSLHQTHKSIRPIWQMSHVHSNSVHTNNVFKLKLHPGRTYWMFFHRKRSYCTEMHCLMQVYLPSWAKRMVSAWRWCHHVSLWEQRARLYVWTSSSWLPGKHAEFRLRSTGKACQWDQIEDSFGNVF